MTDSTRRLLQFLAVYGIVATAAATASANGRFPRAQYLKESATNSSELILSATYGLLLTSDRGKTWHLVCERSVLGQLPSDSDWIDPLLELTSSGTILSGSDRALRISRDRGCSFVTETALPVDWMWFDPARMRDKGNVIDLSLERAKGGTAVVALVADINGPATDHQIYESLDDGATWKPLGAPIVGLVTSVTTLDVAPSDPMRIYVTGRGRTPLASLIVSNDGGQTWSALPISGTEDGGGSYIAAISPTDPNVLYVRTDRWIDDPTTGGSLGDDILHYSNDGGKTWTEILRKQAKMMGFALSPDGKTVLAGFGDPVEGGGRAVDETILGIYRAEAGTANFQRIFDASVTCLTWNQTGVYACASQDRDGFHLGFSPHANFELGNPNALERLLRLPDVKGPLPWPASNNRDICWDDWVGTINVLGLCSRLRACLPPDGGMPASRAPLCGVTDVPDTGTGDGQAGGTGGSSGQGGMGGSPANDAGGRGGATTTSGAGGASGGTGGGPSCDCRMAHEPARRATSGWALLLALVTLGFYERRRRA